MSGEHQIPPGDGEDDGMPLDPAVERALTEALLSAWAPRPLDPGLNELLIEAALEDPLAPPSEAELVESARLRQALEGDGSHPDADLARALRTAKAPEALATDRAQRLVAGATGPIGSGSPAAARPPQTGTRRGGNVVFVTFGAAAATALAAAAAAILYLGPAESDRDEAPAVTLSSVPTLAQSRSTTPLFHEKFATEETSGRIDRIAAVRAREMRQNRYAQWGLR